MHGMLALVGATDIHNHRSNLQYNRKQEKKEKSNV